MLPSGGMYLDMSSVTRNLNYLNTAVIPAKIRMGLGMAGTKFMLDTVMEAPTMPIRRAVQGEIVPYGGERLAGGLRGSGALFVDGVKMGDTVMYGIPRYQPYSYGGTPIMPTTHEACVVFNAPYAVEQHESWPRKTEPTAKMYFMSTKLYGNAAEYIAILAKAVRL